MNILVTLAICAVCVSGESLTRHKRGWGYEPTTMAPGWGWKPTPPPPPPPPPPTGWQQPQPSGWGNPPPPTSGWGTPPPSNGWGMPSNDYWRKDRYYPRPWGGQSRYGRYAEGPYRYRDYGSIRSPSYRRSSSML